MAVLLLPRSWCSGVCGLGDQGKLQKAVGTLMLAQQKPSLRTTTHTGEEPAAQDGPGLDPDTCLQPPPSDMHPDC